MTDLDRLFDEFASRRARGESPEPAEYMRRAGADAARLGAMIDGLLMATPAPEPDPAMVAAFRAWMADEAPMVALRHRHGRRRSDMVQAVMQLLALPERVRDRVADHYHRLETGLLDPSRVDRRIVDELSRLLGARLQDLPRPRGPVAPAPAMMRPAPGAPSAPMDSELSPAPAQDTAMAEVDRLFGVGG